MVQRVFVFRFLFPTPQFLKPRKRVTIDAVMQFAACNRLDVRIHVLRFHLLLRLLHRAAQLGGGDAVGACT